MKQNEQGFLPNIIPQPSKQYIQCESQYQQDKDYLVPRTKLEKITKYSIKNCKPMGLFPQLIRKNVKNEKFSLSISNNVNNSLNESQQPLIAEKNANKQIKISKEQAKLMHEAKIKRIGKINPIKAVSIYVTNIMQEKVEFHQKQNKEQMQSNQNKENYLFPMPRPKKRKAPQEKASKENRLEEKQTRKNENRWQKQIQTQSQSKNKSEVEKQIDIKTIQLQIINEKQLEDQKQKESVTKSSNTERTKQQQGQKLNEIANQNNIAIIPQTQEKQIQNQPQYQQHVYNIVINYVSRRSNAVKVVNESYKNSFLMEVPQDENSLGSSTSRTSEACSEIKAMKASNSQNMLQMTQVLKSQSVHKKTSINPGKRCRSLYKESCKNLLTLGPSIHKKQNEVDEVNSMSSFSTSSNRSRVAEKKSKNKKSVEQKPHIQFKSHPYLDNPSRNNGAKKKSIKMGMKSNKEEKQQVQRLSINQILSKQNSNKNIALEPHVSRKNKKMKSRFSKDLKVNNDDEQSQTNIQENKK